jgi:hypothetical protein
MARKRKSGSCLPGGFFTHPKARFLKTTGCPYSGDDIGVDGVLKLADLIAQMKLLFF